MRQAIAILGLVATIAGPSAAAARTALPVQTVVIETHAGPQHFKMEVAADEASRDHGLMFRKHLARDAGMLFDFKKTVMTAFWMKDTPLSLDIIFVRPDGRIANIAARAVPYSINEIVSAEPIRAVIEINGGLAQTLGIKPGNRVRASIFPGPARP